MQICVPVAGQKHSARYSLRRPFGIGIDARRARMHSKEVVPYIQQSVVCVTRG